MRINRLVAVGIIAGAAVTVAGPSAFATPDTTPTPDPTTSPTKPPVFKFGYDKVQLSTRVVRPGGSLTMTVTCPTAVTATSNGFVSQPKFTTTAKMTHKASARFRSNLRRGEVVNLKISCAKFGFVTYSTKAGKKVKDKTHVPTDPIQTGGGATATVRVA